MRIAQYGLLVRIKYLIATLIFCLYSNVAKSEELLGEWAKSGTIYSLVKNENKILMRVSSGGEQNVSVINRFESDFPLPSYKVIDGFQKDDGVTYTVNVRNILGIRINGLYKGAAQPIKTNEGLLKEFTEKHSKPEFAILQGVHDELPSENIEKYTLLERKKIFFELVKLEDNGLSNIYSKQKIMKKYKMSQRELLNLMGEGVANDWLSELDAE